MIGLHDSTSGPLVPIESPSIAITEAGDAGLDLSWRTKIQGHDLAILITRNLSPAFCEAVLDSHSRGERIILHATVSGWGGTWVEPRVPYPERNLDALAELTEDGFPKEQVVLRIDPVIPSFGGLLRVESVLALAHERKALTPRTRVRVSVLDEYPHVKRRLAKIGRLPLYGARTFAPEYMMRDVVDLLRRMSATYSITFETCAEPQLTALAPELVRAVGCVSARDLAIFGFRPAHDTKCDSQSRFGCLCLEAKHEILDHRSRCAHGCVHCRWE